MHVLLQCAQNIFCDRLVTYPTGRYPYPGPARAGDNSVWMMANPNWASINIHLGEVRAIIKLVAIGLRLLFSHFRHVLILWDYKICMVHVSFPVKLVVQVTYVLTCTYSICTQSLFLLDTEH